MITIRDELLISPNVHDGLLTGLLLEREKRARLFIEKVDGESVCLVMEGVVRLKADDFREGNIILSVTVTSGDALSLVDVADAYDVSTDDTRFLPAAMERHRASGLMTVRLDPSYGATIVCLCASLSAVE